MLIPQVRRELLALAEDLEQGIVDNPEEAASLIRLLEKELYRRPYVRKAPAQRKRPDTQAVLRYAVAHPDADYVEIAAHFGTNTGRISEALAGYRE